MKQSQLFTKTQKEAPRDEVSLNAKLLIRAGFIDKEMAGVYSFLPLGLKTLNKITGIIREEMNSIGAQELYLTALQNPELWKKTGRWDDKVLDVWFKTELKNGGKLGLGATHEEPLTNLIKKHISSYKDLPVYAYQFQNKFRNETRPKAGILRLREFIMKDLYSFNADLKDLEKYYEKVKAAYIKIFNRCGLGDKTYLTFASGGSFSKYSHEFQTLTSAGEDLIYICDQCRVAVNKEIIKDVEEKCPECQKKLNRQEKAVEVGNIFKLGTRFSEPLGLTFTGKDGQKKPVVMGCYGIGPQRLMGTIVEISHDAKGILWPESVAPFRVHLLSLGQNEKAEKIYQDLVKNNVEVLYDDRDVSAGEKFAEADLIGIPYRIVVSSKTLATDSVEIKKRNEKKEQIVKIKDFAKNL